MQAEIFISDKIDMPNKHLLVKFLQKVVNRAIQGHCQYGAPHRDKRYMSRKEVESESYRKTGNIEHLLNEAVYAWLETVAPENKKSHFNPLVDSATRGRF